MVGNEQLALAEYSLRQVNGSCMTANILMAAVCVGTELDTVKKPSCR